MVLHERLRPAVYQDDDAFAFVVVVDDVLAGVRVHAAENTDVVFNMQRVQSWYVFHLCFT